MEDHTALGEALGEGWEIGPIEQSLSVINICREKQYITVRFGGVCPLSYRLSIQLHSVISRIVTKQELSSVWRTAV
jgi:hypothetical protein